MRYVCILVALACSACVSSESVPIEDLLPAESAGKADQTRLILNANYTVPVPSALATPELVAAATPPGYLVGVTMNDGEVLMQYMFPPAITGSFQDVILTGRVDRGVLHMTGEAGEADCVANSSQEIVCSSHLPGIMVDLAAVESKLHERRAPADEVANRLQIAGIFRNDPIGDMVLR